ncbi:MAG: DNA repair protein RecN [Brockia lithotrophica]|nr:DNA repair protein RecN [Brockia lithotrophica]
MRGMLRELYVRNVAVIEELRLEFSPGLTVITGESGSGKSVLLEAIGLVLGRKARADLVRSGESRAWVEALFDIETPEERREIQGLLEAYGLVLDDDYLLLGREIGAQGRSIARVGGRPVPASLLRDLAPHLVQLHEQQDQSLLTSDEVRAAWLDTYAGARERRQAYTSSLRRYLEALAAWERWEKGRREALDRLDLLTYQLGEIEGVDPVVGEDRELEEVYRRLKNADALYRAVGEAAAALLEENRALDWIGAAANLLSKAAATDPELEPLAARLDGLFFDLQELGHTLKSRLPHYLPDEERLTEVAQRLERLRYLTKKYGGSLEAVLAYRDAARAEREELLLYEERGERLQKDVQAAREELKVAAENLSGLRRAYAEPFAAAVQREVRKLEMEHARFEVVLVPEDPFADDGIRLRRIPSSGFERVEFWFSANAGEPPRPVERVASGGELSRLALAVRAVLHEEGGATLVFDEIDTGVGGRAGEAIGRMLKDLSRTRQVVAITHLPQVAAFADHHISLGKVVGEGKTRTTAAALRSEEERVRELARMLAGRTVAQTARDHARSLLRAAATASRRGDSSAGKEAHRPDAADA